MNEPVTKLKPQQLLTFSYSTGKYYQCADVKKKTKKKHKYQCISLVYNYILLVRTVAHNKKQMSKAYTNTKP